MPALILWLLGVPLSVIILLYLILWLVLPLAPPPVYAAPAPQAPIVPQPGN